jgi:hypothetical protein
VQPAQPDLQELMVQRDRKDLPEQMAHRGRRARKDPQALRLRYKLAARSRPILGRQPL